MECSGEFLKGNENRNSMNRKNVGRPPGTPKTGGRVVGTPNKRTLEIAELLDGLNCSPIEGMALIAECRLPCGECAGKGKQRYKRQDGKLAFDPEGKLLPCLGCYGTGFAAVDLGIRLRAYAEIAQYLYAKRKAVEVEQKDLSRGTFTLEELLESYRKCSTTGGNS